MKLTKCISGHYYDEEKYTSCPYCSGNDSDNGTAKANGGTTGAQDSDVTTPIYMPKKPVLEETTPVAPVKKPVNEPAGRPVDDDVTQAFFAWNGPEKAEAPQVTVPMYKKPINPVVGWLVCIDGNNRGKSYELHAGKNFIGRSPEMDVCIEGDSTISRIKHAILVYEPKARIFFAQTGESHELFYLNDNVVLSNVQIKDRDIITIGKTTLVFVAFCDDRYGWDR